MVTYRFENFGNDIDKSWQILYNKRNNIIATNIVAGRLWKRQLIHDIRSEDNKPYLIMACLALCVVFFVLKNCLQFR